jgi:signal transduction histidine kinase/CheY-like chemotaxis protein
MKWSDIRTRVMVAALLPVLIVGILLSVAFLVGRSSDLNDAYQQRARALARQLASASEYGIFSANETQLQSIGLGAAREPDVRSVDIFDSKGILLTRVGTPLLKSPEMGIQESTVHDASNALDILVQPVHGSQISLDDVFEVQAQALPPPAQLLGHVVLVMSRQSLTTLERGMLLLGVLITMIGLVLGAMVAFLISRGVLTPIQQISRQVARLENGELDFRALVEPSGPFAALQRGLNSMAQHLQDNRQLLEYRVEKATQDLRTQKEAAEEATRTKSQFLAAASHDLRQPSHALGMFVERLLQFPHGDEEETVLDHLSASVRAQQDLLDSLLDIAQLDARTVNTSIRALSVADLFASLASGLHAQADAKKLFLRVRQSPLWVLSDSALLTRMLLNLIHNALRYTERGGVLVACRPVQGRRIARIQVWDTGVGIAPQHQREIFKEFFQVSNNERDRSKGLGLGLGIVERTARLLGHTVSVKSVLGRGSCFSIELPLAPSQPSQNTLVDQNVMPLNELQGVRLLVIDDDVLVAEAMHMLLSSWGCDVAVASSIDAALGLLRGNKTPQLILTDYRLRAGENGLDAVRLIRDEAKSSIPACLMSGEVESNLPNLCHDAGIHFLQKPVRPTVLRNQILQLLR